MNEALGFRVVTSPMVPRGLIELHDERGIVLRSGLIPAPCALMADVEPVVHLEVSMAQAPVKRRLAAMTLERVDAKLALLAYDLESAEAVERIPLLIEADRLLDVRLALVRPTVRAAA